MAIKLPNRNYFTFPELMKRWECEEADFFHLLLSEKLVPSYFFSEELKIFDLEEERLHRENDPFGDVPMTPQIRMTHEFLYLIKPMQVAHDMILFDVIADTRTGRPTNPTSFFMPPVRMRDYQFSFTKVLENGVVMMSEVALFEGDAGKPDGAPNDEKPLSTRERDTLLTIVGVLLELIQTHKAGRDSEAAVIKEILQNNYDDKPGISKRNLEQKFAEAKRILGNR